MKVRLAYGQEGLDLSLPDDLNVDIVQPQYAEPLADQGGAVRDALRSPIGSRPLRDLAKPSDTIAIVCNDVTRPTPYRTILPVLLDELSHVAAGNIVLMIATGTHRPCTPQELGMMFGEQVVTRFRIVQNDAHDRSLHALAGVTTSGNEVRLHKEYRRCDVRVLTGFIEPHFFAGFSGGGKACMPGMAYVDTIMRNHNARNIDDPGATWGVTRDNPIWEEIREAALMTPATFLLNVALDRRKQITAVFAGDLDRAHERGCACVRRHATAGVQKRYDIVITSNSGYPLDMNLYQSVKGMSAAARIAKAGGVIIVAAECRDGIPDHGWYKRLLFESECPAALLERIRAGDCRCQDAWQAQIHAAVCATNSVYIRSDSLSHDDVQRAMLIPCHDIAATVGQLLASYGRQASICVLPDGPQTIPYISTAQNP